MAVGESPDVETVMNMNIKPNPDGKEVYWAKTEPRQKKNQANPDGIPDEMNKEYYFKPRPAYNVFPAKKRLVKKMMFDYLVHKFSVFYHDRSRGRSYSAGASKTDEANSCCGMVPPPESSPGKRINQIYPYPPFPIPATS